VNLGKNLFWLCVTACAPLCSASALDFNLHLESVGARGGFGANTAGERLHQAEVFSIWNLPWRWDFESEWHLHSAVEATAGWIGGNEADAFVGGAGPDLLLSYKTIPVSLEGGVNPTGISRHTFGTVDVGTDFQFTTHIGLNWDICSRLRMGYRFQHMSNAGMSTHNPGMNMHLFGVSYLF
jgi:lipid A 3-O-deacylase